MATKFIIIRKDLNIDASVIESDGLTIGRLTGNDLTLNHPTVSRTHAGIKEENGDFWIFNLSNANGTILNGALVDKAPLTAGDVIQIGSFALYVSMPNNTLTLTVEMSVNPLRAENAGTSMLAPVDQSGKTMMLNPQMLQAQQQKPTAKGTQRLSLTGKLTGMLGSAEELALKVFWDKRKRDAGKMAETTQLKPNLLRGRVGKARFNWRSTSDLRRPWPVSLFIWGTLIVTVVSVISIFAYKNAYSPGPLSPPHARMELAATDAALAVAKRPNGNSCTTCHSMTASMQSQCADCHTTPGFKSTVSHEHEMAGVSCGECHGREGVFVEHVGANIDLVKASKDSCLECHKAGYVYTSHALGKEIALNTPHGGSDIGYPVTGGKWTWAGWSEEKWKKRDLPKTASAFDAKGQFHIIHVDNGGPLERVQCSDCHKKGFDAANLTVGVRESCAACHSANPTEIAKAGGAECTSCHEQHLEGKDAFALVRTRQVNAERK